MFSHQKGVALSMRHQCDTFLRLEAKIMNLWDKHQEFPADFLAQHHDFVLYDVFHQIKALLLYPLNCDCDENCACEATRAKIVFSLNVDLYNKARMTEENPDLLHVMR